MSTSVLAVTPSGKTVLTIAGEVALKISLEKPSALFGSEDRTDEVLAETMQEAAERVIRAHDWQVLKAQAVHAGDGVQTAFDLPAGYIRMPKDGEVWSTRWQHPLQHISPEEWLHLDVREFDIVTGTWALFGGVINYKPALAQDEQARFWYVTEYGMRSALGQDKAAFDADDDTFRLDDRLLKLAAIWVWREAKGLDYGEEQRAFETALAREIAKDSAAHVLTQASRRSVGGKVSYPWNIVP